MFALWKHGEVRIEGDYAINMGHRTVEFFCYDFLELGRQVAEQALRFVQDIDQFALIVVERLANIFQFLYLFFR